MGAFDDIESSSSKSRAMLNRGLGDSRRKTLLLFLLGGIFILSLVGFRKHDEIGDIIQTQKESWRNTDTNTTSSYKPPTVSPEEDETHTSAAHALESEQKPSKNASSKDTPSKDVSSKDASSSSSYSSSKTNVAPGPTFGERKIRDESLIDIRNETLGFEKIYVLNMAGRTDKLDAMRLAASLTNFNFDIMEGVSGADVPKKALSGTFEDREGAAGVIGCWRGHMNFARTVIRERHASAMIMEDDADWDVDFRSQLEKYALGSQTLLEQPYSSKDPAPASPYGDGWDLLWMGHCGTQPLNGSYERFLWKNDKTVTPPEHRVNYANLPDMDLYPNNTRVQFFSKGATCTYAYALSFHGAQKILKWMSMDVYNKPVDFGLHDMCSDTKRGFKCISVFPQIIADHKPAGGANKDSDIGDQGEETNVRKKGFTYNVVTSVRLNADALIDGRKADLETQWEGDVADYIKDVTGPVEFEWRDEEVEDVGD